MSETSKRAKTAPRRTANRTLKKPARDWKPVFLAELAKTGNVSAAVHKAGIARSVAYEARSVEDLKDPAARVQAAAFARAWDEALDVAIDALEAEARRRAVQGVLEPVGWHKGVAGGKVRKYSDTLLIVLLKAHRPEKYRETIQQQHSGAVALVTSDEMAKARDEVERWERERFAQSEAAHAAP